MKMEAQTKNCKNCQKDFTIESDDFGFYEKIKVPPPTWCPDCRYYRRLAYRNPTVLRETECMCMGEDLINGVYQNTAPHEHGASPCGENIETTIKEDSGLIIYCDKCYKKEVY